MKAAFPDIACGFDLGDTSCALPRKHDGDHKAAEVVLVDRRLRPVNRRYVVVVKGCGPVDHRRSERDLLFATVNQYKARDRVLLGPNFEDDKRGTSIHPVRRPAVRVGDHWLRRCPDLEVVA